MASNNFFIPKKQRQAMRERRKRKRLAEKGEFHPVVTEKEEAKEKVNAKDEASDSNGAIRKQNGQSIAPSSDSSRPLSLINVSRSNTITIPADIQGDSKKVKKFRKDARRKARSEGRDETKLVFVEAGSKRKKFPRINELLQKEQESKLVEQTKSTDDSVEDAVKQKYVALDCEMVGVGTKGQQSVLARASIVDWWGKVLLDTYVNVPVTVTDFRTKYSGIEPKHLQNAIDPAVCRQKVADIVRDRILVGHALHNDLGVLMLQHTDLRDTATYQPFQRLAATGRWRPRKLRDLVVENCGGMKIQEGSHDSVQDARATMELYKTVHAAWEEERQANSEKRMKKKSKH